MTITIVPFTVNPNSDCKALQNESCVLSTQAGCVREEDIMRRKVPITYWGIYLDEKHISFVSTKELAEKTKTWMEKWLRQG